MVLAYIYPDAPYMLLIFFHFAKQISQRESNTMKYNQLWKKKVNLFVGKIRIVNLFVGPFL